MTTLHHSDGPYARRHWDERCRIVRQQFAPVWEGHNWVAGPQSSILSALAIVAQAERLEAAESVVEYLRHVVSCGGTESRECQKQFGRQREARLKLSPEWATWLAAKKEEDARNSAAYNAADTGDDRGGMGGFLSSDD